MTQKYIEGRRQSTHREREREREKRSGSSGRQESTIGRGRERREGAHREECTIGCERDRQRGEKELRGGGSVGDSIHKLRVISSSRILLVSGTFSFLCSLVFVGLLTEVFCSWCRSNLVAGSEGETNKKRKKNNERKRLLLWGCRSRRISCLCMEEVMGHGVGIRRWICCDWRDTKRRRWTSSAAEEIPRILIMWSPSWITTNLSWSFSATFLTTIRYYL